MKGPDQNVGLPNLISSGDRPIELDDFRDTRSRDFLDTTTSWAAHPEHEAQPLLEAENCPTATTSASDHQLGFRHLDSFSGSARRDRRGHCLNIMEKVKKSKVACYVDKLAVTSEPGLTNAQLMLTNFDLKPGSFPSNNFSEKRTKY